MDVIFLGTNGWYDSLIKSNDYYIVLDAGNGINKLDQYYQKANPVYILLSHFHLDHIVGLHILAKFSFAQGLVIAGPKGTRKILNTFWNCPVKKMFCRSKYNLWSLSIPPLLLAIGSI